MTHLESEWPSQQKIQIYFFLFHYFSTSTCRHNFGKTVARKSSIGGLHFFAGERYSDNLYFPASSHNRLAVCN